MKKTLLFVSSLISVLIIHAQPCLPTVSYPITWEIEDNSGNNYDPTIYGGATVTGGYLHIGYNDDDYIDIPSDALNNVGDFTIQFDFRLTDFNLSGASPTNTLIAGASDVEESEFAISYEKSINAIVVALKGSGNIFNIILEEETWYCLQVVRDGSDVTVFIDGDEVETIEMSDELLEISFLEIGQELDCPAGCFAVNQSLNGDIDNFSIYPCTFQEANCQPFIAACDTMLFFPFDTNVNDYSGNENHGIVNGDANVDPGFLNIGYNNDDNIEVPVSALNGLNEFTISFNFKLNAFNTTGTSPTNTFIAGTAAGIEHEFALSYEKSSNAFEIAIHNIGGIIPATINENEWYCVSFNWENDTVSVMLNGVLLPDYLVFPDDPISVAFLEIGQELDCLAGCFAENQSLNGSMDNLIIMDCNEFMACSEFPLAIFEQENVSGIKVYPNPVADVVRVDWGAQFINPLIQITDVRGISVFNNDINLTQEQHLNINVENLVPGVYQISLIDIRSGLISTQSFVKY
ncbi:MAG: hypothetical protein IPI31_19360 [Bacteroidetes bacterium]|nr:hypothetical protein [Bacteroidota bacterium]